jgi:hypothetical protein
MLRSATGIKDYRMKATDGEIGKALEFYFDDRSWIIQYLVADTGDWLEGRKVLISPAVFLEPDWKRREFPVTISRGWIENSPLLEEDKPVSLQKKNEMSAYVGHPTYIEPKKSYIHVCAELQASSTPPRNSRKKQTGDRHLRSTDGIIGYRVKATNGEIGVVEDLLIDDEKWIIRFLVMDTRDFLAGGKKVLVSPDWIARVNWSRALIQVNLTRQKVDGGPRYDPDEPVSIDMETRVYDYFGTPAK